MDYKFDKAFNEWIDIVGINNVIQDIKTIKEVETATFQTNNNIVGIVKPKKYKEVKACVDIACKYKIPVYTVSTGKNWGYGSSVPVIDKCVVIEMSGMNRIRDYNEKFSYVSIEPGVTFRQLNTFLRGKKSKMFLNCPGNSADVSVIGLTMERGLVPGPEANRWEHILNLEVILPNGQEIRTGYGRFGDLKLSKLHKQGLGPFIDGLFTQSNFGIVTSITIHITPFPDFFQYFTFTTKNLFGLGQVIEELRELRFKKILGDSCAFYNDYRLISFVEQYPWEKTKGKVPLPKGLLTEIRQTLEGGQWYCEAAIEGFSEKDGENKREYIKEKLSKYTDDLYFHEPNVENSYYNINLNTGLNSVYWRKKSKVPKKLNPNLDKCGVIWCVPAIPFESNELNKCIKIIEEVLDEYDFEPGITIRCMTPRVLYVLAGIIYDREVKGEDEKAMKCYENLVKKLYKEGYIPYRLGIQSMNTQTLFDDKSREFFKSLKKHMDTDNLLSPGRYEF